MHCCLAVRAAAKAREVRSASRALSVPVLDDRSTAKSAETVVNDRLLHFMPRLLYVEKILISRLAVGRHDDDGLLL
jgi:hypothetical protein